MPNIIRPSSGKKSVPVTSGHNLLWVLGHAVDGLRRARVPYALVGAWAVAVWGRPRATLDLDFLVMVSEDGLWRLGPVMARSGMAIDETWLEWNPMLRGSQLRLQYREVAVDLLRPRDDHDREIFQRRRKKRLEGRYYWFAAPEDIILQKLKVGRPRDFEDALSVLERSKAELDRRYLRRWGKRLRISGELEYIFAL